MKKIIIIFIFVTTTLLFVFAVCNNTLIQTNAKEFDSHTNDHLITLSNTQTSSLLTDKLKDYLFEKNPSFKVEELKIVKTIPIEQGELLMATFISNNQLYECMFQTQKADGNMEERIIYGDYRTFNTKAAFTYHLFPGNVARVGEPKKTCVMIGGMINEKKIKSLEFIFNDGVVSKIEVGVDAAAYCYTRIDKFDCISFIHAFDEYGKVIYEYPPYPPKMK